MSSLAVYNWTPWGAAVQVNSIGNTVWSPLDPSQNSTQFYYPASGTVPRDLTALGKSGVWGRTNQLTIRFDTGANALSFPSISDPAGANPSTDLLLWIFPQFVVLSQDNQFLIQVTPSSS